MSSFIPENPPVELINELTVLGSIIADNQVLDSVALTTDDFAYPMNIQTWELIEKLRDEGKPIDPITLSAERPNISPYFFELTDWARPGTSGGYYADLVREVATRRHLREAAMVIHDMSQDPARDTNEITDASRKLIDQAIGIHAVTTETSEELVHQVAESIGHTSVGMPTPWRSLTRVIRGFRPGGLYVIAARPAVGKSALALQIAHTLEQFGRVAYFSLEMGKVEVIQRLIAQGAVVPLDQVDGSVKLTDDHRQRIDSWRAGYRGQIMVDDRAGMTMSDIRAQARTWNREAPLSAIVIDYVQLATSTSKDVNRANAVAEMTRAAKVMAKDFGVPVILLSQLNRNPEARVDKRPALADLRESGAIEQDADVVILLYNASQSRDEPSGLAGDDLELIIAKNRQGPSMTAHLRWDGRYVSATDLT